MKVWQRTRIEERCKGCGKPLPTGTSVQVVLLVDIPKRIIRCEGCAGEPANVDELEAFDVAEERRESSKPIERQTFEFTGATRDLFDVKQAQTGERE